MKKTFSERKKQSPCFFLRVQLGWTVIWSKYLHLGKDTATAPDLVIRACVSKHLFKLTLRFFYYFCKNFTKKKDQVKHNFYICYYCNLEHLWIQAKFGIIWRYGQIGNLHAYQFVWFTIVFCLITSLNTWNNRYILFFSLEDDI